MPTSSEAFVTPSVLRWARNRARTTPEIVAKRVGTKPEKVSAWEAGQQRPTFRQAMAIAGTLKVPFGYLFLPSPPEEKIPLPDFRTIGDTVEYLSAPSPDFIDLLNDVVAKQLWYREFLEDEEADALPFVGKFAANADVEDIAGDISERVGITEEFRRSCDSWESFLQKLIERVEFSGILVMRTGLVAGNHRRRVSEKEFRGFSISDKLAPLIFINTSDSKAAQIFTLGHELAHIWMGQTGISNESLAYTAETGIERKCNQISTQLLVPRATFVDRWNQSGKLTENIRRLASHFRVSTLVILRRARELNTLTEKTFQEAYSAEDKRLRQIMSRKKDDGSVNFYSTLFTRNSHTFTRALVDSVAAGRALYTDAADMLSVRVSTLNKISARLAELDRKR